MIIYEGKSEIDCKPIVAILTGFNKSSKNPKTGDMPQVWIIRSDIHPVEALRIGEDISVCGSCPHRPKVTGKDALRDFSRSCYVNPMSFNGVFRAYRNGTYPKVNIEELSVLLKDRNIRIGAYGDPAAVPIHVWNTLLKYCKSTGYTHQWRDCSVEYAQYCMASCDNDKDVSDAVEKGYRTFYVQNVKDIHDTIKEVNGIKLAWCPASKEKGKVTTCAKCMVCSGTRGAKSNVTIMLH